MSWVITVKDTIASLAQEGHLSTIANMEYLWNELLCIVCFELYENPVCLGCGHCFCKSCIMLLQGRDESREKHFECPLCKKRLRKRRELEYMTCYPLKNIINKIRENDGFLLNFNDFSVEELEELEEIIR